MLYKHKLKFLPVFMVVALLVATTLINTSFAASVTVLSDTMTDQTISAASDHTIVFTIGTALTDGDGILVTFDPTSSSFDLDTAPVTTGDFAFSCATGTITTSTETIDTTADTIGLAITTIGSCSGAITLTVNGTNKILNPGTSGSKTISVATYNLGTPVAFGGTSAAADTLIDSGSLAVPIITDGTVDITATVPPTLTFAIRNATDDGDTATCSLGTLTVGSVSPCDYRLAVDTNATGGYTIFLQAATGLVSGSDEINPIADNGTVALGVEGYGIAVTGATTGAAADPVPTYTEEGVFATDDTPIPTSPTAPQALFSINKPADYTPGTLADSTLITHLAAISAVTPAGSYAQTITYTVVGNF